MRRIYQCLRCGLVFRSKREVIRHLKNIEKVSDLVADYYYQYFTLRGGELE
jgi:hypothetical protein